MNFNSLHVCPATISGILDNKLRRKLQNPEEILKPFVKEGMTVLDLGCGPGFFSIEMARLVDGSGKVIAVDLQKKMLDKTGKKLDALNLNDRVVLQKCEADKICVSEKVDFVNAFYVLHEVPALDKTLAEIKEIMNPQGLFLICEPYIHVSKKAFERTISKAEKLGFVPVAEPDIFFSRAVLLKLG